MGRGGRRKEQSQVRMFNLNGNLISLICAIKKINEMYILGNKRC